MIPATPLPDFRSPAFLRAHIEDTLAFYLPRAIDPTGGLFHFLRDDGSVYDAHTRHLVSSTRYVVTLGMAVRRGLGGDLARRALQQAFDFLRMHRNPESGGFAWLLDWRAGQARVLDATNHAYGLAFVLLAHAQAHMAGVAGAHAGIAQTFDLLERRFWEPAHGLYADEATPDWTLLPYRGQNANMHLCEALLAAFDATKETRYLERAALLAEHITVRQAGLADGLVWEHYKADWSVDWDYNKDDKSNIFRPWGFQPGHLTEWTKLLLQLHERRPDAGWSSAPAASSTPPCTRPGTANTAVCTTALRPTAASATATSTSGCRPSRWPLRPGWPSSPASSATGPPTTTCGPTRGATSWTMNMGLVAHPHGRQPQVLSDEKSPAGKVDYHTMGACHDLLDSPLRG
jgi:mannose/cellobiose epimerase-like protein (N-acyl-D-glucosamine 2-epimerase family)